MKRWERRQRIKEQRLAQKEARKRKRLEAEAQGGVGGLNPAEAPVQPGAAAGEVTQSAEVVSAGSRVPADAPETAGAGLAAPTLLPACTVEEAAADAKQANAGAHLAVRQSKLVSADEAAEMLSQASRDLSDVIQAGRRALSQVSPQRLAEAAEALNEKRMAEAAHGKPQTRPRRGTDPVITLMKMMVQAVSLLQRVLNRLHPKLKMAA